MKIALQEIFFLNIGSVLDRFCIKTRPGFWGNDELRNEQTIPSGGLNTGLLINNSTFFFFYFIGIICGVKLTLQLAALEELVDTFLLLCDAQVVQR